MAKGITHHKANITTGILCISVVFVLYGGITQYLYASIVGVIYGLLFGPDADIQTATYQESFVGFGIENILRKSGMKKMSAHKIGKWFVNIMELITMPFGIFIEHRSWVSHAPIISTVIRLAYIELLLWLLPYTFSYSITILYFTNPTSAILLFLTFATIDFIHFILDGGMIIFKGKKRYLLGKWFYNITKK